MTKTIHLAWGESRAESVRDALRMQACDDDVIALSDTSSLGPIDTLDPDDRRAWFGTYTRNEYGLDEARTDPEASWAQAMAADAHPVYWVSFKDPGEHACFLRFAARMAERAFDVVEVAASDVPLKNGVDPIWSLAQLRPEDIITTRLIERRRPFSSVERQTAVAMWSRLQTENAPLRVVRDARLMSAPLTHFDAVILRLAKPECELLIALVGRVYTHLTDEEHSPVGDEFLFARILALGQIGALEVTGTGPGMRDFQVRLSERMELLKADTTVG